MFTVNPVEPRGARHDFGMHLRAEIMAMTLRTERWNEWMDLAASRAAGTKQGNVIEIASRARLEEEEEEGEEEEEEEEEDEEEEDE